jgi:hypothetical protein
MPRDMRPLQKDIILMLKEVLLLHKEPLRMQKANIPQLLEMPLMLKEVIPRQSVDLLTLRVALPLLLAEAHM